MKKRGFTLVELLVVIAVIALLMAILMPALKLAKDKAMVVVCGNNIRQQLIGFQLYGAEYNNKVFGDYGWLDGTDRWKYKIMMKLMGMSIERSIVENWDTAPLSQIDVSAPGVFYCPSNVSRRASRRQLYWDFDIGSGARMPWRIIAYLWILDNEPPDSPKEAIWSSDSTGLNVPKASGKEKILGDDNKIWVTRLDVRNSSEAELITDIAYSDTVTGLFDVITAGGSGGGGPGMAESSSHVKNSEKLYGINVGFCDNHVEWRNFNKIKKRWAWGSGPINWW